MADNAGERFARGMETVARLFPPGTVGVPRFQYPPEIAGDWGQFSVSTMLGDIWGRPGLEMKNRAMITIAMLTALGRLDQLRAYIVGGLNLGLTRSEVCEIIYQVAVYAGFPAAIQGFAVANDVFAEIDRASPGA